MSSKDIWNLPKRYGKIRHLVDHIPVEHIGLRADIHTYSANHHGSLSAQDRDDLLGPTLRQLPRAYPRHSEDS